MLRLSFSIDGEQRVFPLTGKRVRLGRGSDNDVVLSDVSVSRNHAEIRRGAEGAWTVHDLRSTNGVELNRVAVESAPLRGGEPLGIAPFELLVESIDPPLATSGPRSVLPGGGRTAGGGGSGVGPGGPAPGR